MERLTSGINMLCRAFSFFDAKVPVKQLLISVACVLSLLSITGCGEQRAGPVNGDLARTTLIEVLETWKRGGTIAELRAREPEIVVQEAHWLQGKVLQDYRLLDDGRKEDANLFCEVELTLSDNNAKSTKKTVTYVVGTDPVLTVFRAIL